MSPYEVRPRCFDWELIPILHAIEASPEVVRSSPYEVEGPLLFYPDTSCMLLSLHGVPAV
jgi:hypothetical protein